MIGIQLFAKAVKSCCLVLIRNVPTLQTSASYVNYRDNWDEFSSFARLLYLRAVLTDFANTDKRN